MKTSTKVIIGGVVSLIVFIVLMAILGATGVLKNTKVKEDSTPTQNNTTDIQVNSNSDYVSSSNSEQTGTLTGSSAAAVDQNQVLYGFTPQVDVTDNAQKSVFLYYTSDGRLKGPMPEYVALNGTKFVKFQGRECVSWRSVPISDMEKAEMATKGVVTNLEQQLESCSKKPYCVGLHRVNDQLNLCTTDDLDDKFIPSSCLEKNKDNQCIRAEEGATHLGYNLNGTWMRESEMQRGGLSGNANVPMKRLVANNNMEYLELRDFDRQRFSCTAPIPTVTGTLDKVVDKCSAYETPPGGCRAILKTATGYGGCSDIRHVTGTLDTSLSKFAVSPSLVKTDQVTHVFNERLMDISKTVFNVADTFYYNRNHAEFKPKLTTDVPGWQNALLDL